MNKTFRKKLILIKPAKYTGIELLLFIHLFFDPKIISVKLDYFKSLSFIIVETRFLVNLRKIRRF